MRTAVYPPETNTPDDREYDSQHCNSKMNSFDFFSEHPYCSTNEQVLNKQAKRLFQIGQGGISLPGLSYFSKKVRNVDKKAISMKIADSISSLNPLSQNNQKNIKRLLLPITFTDTTNRCQSTIDFFDFPMRNAKDSNLISQSVMKDNNDPTSKKIKKQGVQLSQRRKAKDIDQRRDTNKETFVQPAFMQDRGSMCITELWPESMKLELVRSNETSDKKPRELFHPKRIPSQHESSSQQTKHNESIHTQFSVNKSYSRKYSPSLFPAVEQPSHSLMLNDSIFDEDIKNPRSTLPSIFNNSQIISPEKRTNQINSSQYLQDLRPDVKGSLLTNEKVSRNRQYALQKLSALKNECEDVLESNQEFESQINQNLNSVKTRLQQMLSKFAKN